MSVHLSKSLWDAPRGDIDRGHGYLPPELIYNWTDSEIQLSTAYARGEIAGTSKNTDYITTDRKGKMMKRLETALCERSNFSADRIAEILKIFSDHLEDPGLLENLEYFQIPESDFMIMFYLAVFEKRVAEIMGYTHNYGKDLQGVERKIPEDDVWYQMSLFESMNINERIKAKSIVDFILTHNIQYATSFGGGIVPEKYYGLPSDLHLTVFDDGKVPSEEELFKDEKLRSNVRYIRESLAHATKHPELLTTQDLVWMHGVSMYLGTESMVGALLSGFALLKPKGYMEYDYLIWTQGMRRVFHTQCWPQGPNGMAIDNTVDEAIARGRKHLELVNQQLGGKAFFDAVAVDCTLIEPWGVQSVRFTAQKHC